MQTHIITRAAAPALALIAWLLLPQTAQCFYNPSTGRWLSRDPINERGVAVTKPYLHFDRKEVDGSRALSYVFVANTPVNKLDILGLSCKDPCGWAIKHASENEIGITVCCGGKKYPCLIFSGGSVAATDPTARKVIDACTMVHEQVHVDDPNYKCPKQCLWKHPTYGDWADPDPATHLAGEHAAYTKNIDCLQNARSQCGGDSECEAQIDAEISTLRKKMEHDYP